MTDWREAGSDGKGSELHLLVNDLHLRWLRIASHVARFPIELNGKHDCASASRYQGVLLKQQFIKVQGAGGSELNNECEERCTRLATRLRSASCSASASQVVARPSDAPRTIVLEEREENSRSSLRSYLQGALLLLYNNGIF